jgi:hypothetical protein
MVAIPSNPTGQLTGLPAYQPKFKAGDLCIHNNQYAVVVEINQRNFSVFWLKDSSKSTYINTVYNSARRRLEDSFEKVVV